MMSDTVLVSILGGVFLLLASIVSFVLGQRSERQRQSLTIRAEMLKPIEEWLRGAERMVGILGDTVASVSADSPLPVTYSLEERRKATQFMIEKTNIVLGILQSNSLGTRRTKRLAAELSQTIRALDSEIKYVLLPLDDQVISRSVAKTLTQEFLLQVAQVKLKFESEIQQAHSLIAQLKTAFT